MARVEKKVLTAQHKTDRTTDTTAVILAVYDRINTAAKLADIDISYNSFAKLVNAEAAKAEAAKTRKAADKAASDASKASEAAKLADKADKAEAEAAEADKAAEAARIEANKANAEARKATDKAVKAANKAAEARKAADKSEAADMSKATDNAKARHDKVTAKLAAEADKAEAEAAEADKADKAAEARAAEADKAYQMCKATAGTLAKLAAKARKAADNMPYTPVDEATAAKLAAEADKADKAADKAAKLAETARKAYEAQMIAIAQTARKAYGEKVVTAAVYEYIVTHDWDTFALFTAASASTWDNAIETPAGLTANMKWQTGLAKLAEAGVMNLHSDKDGHPTIAALVITRDGRKAYATADSKTGNPRGRRFNFMSLFRTFVEPALLATTYNTFDRGEVTFNMETHKRVSMAYTTNKAAK